MARPTLYWKSTCTSCRSARAIVQGKGTEFDDVNYAKKGLEESVVKAIVAAAGSVARVLNTRHEIAKAKGWAEKPPSVTEFAAAVAREPNLIRRPIFIRGKQVLVGYDKTTAAEWDALK
jgi:arsenate reductase-like glutaredoxin family protein